MVTQELCVNRCVEREKKFRIIYIFPLNPMYHQESPTQMSATSGLFFLTFLSPFLVFFSWRFQSIPRLFFLTFLSPFSGLFVPDVFVTILCVTVLFRQNLRIGISVDSLLLKYSLCPQNRTTISQTIFKLFGRAIRTSIELSTLEVQHLRPLKGGLGANL